MWTLCVGPGYRGDVGAYFINRAFLKSSDNHILTANLQAQASE